METIFYYDNYRDFLRDSHDVKNRACFSWRAISHRAKINNPNFLRQVMLGGKNLSLKTIEPVGKALGLRGEELAYWFELVNYCQSEPGENRERLRLELAKMKGSIRPVQISSGLAEYYGRWYIPVIRELIALYDFRDDFELLGLSLVPPILEREARYAVQVLEKFHFIVKDGKGKWVQTEKALRSGTSCESSCLLRYHQWMLEKAAQSLTHCNKEERLVSGMTMGVSKGCYKMILAEFKKFKNCVAALVQNDSQSDRVMNLSMQIFPVGIVGGKGK